MYCAANVYDTVCRRINETTPDGHPTYRMHKMHKMEMRALELIECLQAPHQLADGTYPPAEKDWNLILSMVLEELGI